MESSHGKIYLVIFTGQEAFLPQSLKVEFEELAEHVEILALMSK
jgi:hypothetical protein